jgi:hypothetical protein
VAGFIDHAHPTLTQALLEFIAAIEDGLSADRWRRLAAVIRTVLNVVRETGATDWALFHSLIRLLHDPARVKTFAKKILAAGDVSGKETRLLSGNLHLKVFGLIGIGQVRAGDVCD